MFTGTVEARSHEGGLLVHFEGSSPALNAIMVRADDGTYIGKVDGVIGSTNHPLAHIAHIDRSLDMDALIGVSVTVRAKQKPKEQRGDRRDTSRGSDRRDGGRNQRGGRDDRGRRDNNRGFRNDRGGRDNRGFRSDRGGERQQRGTFNDNDWTCPECKNSNFAFRNVCNRCEAPRPGGGGGGGRRDRSDRGGRDNNRGFRNDRGGRDNNRGFRNDRGGRDNNRRFIETTVVGETTEAATGNEVERSPTTIGPVLSVKIPISHLEMSATGVRNPAQEVAAVVAEDEMTVASAPTVINKGTTTVAEAAMVASNVDAPNKAVAVLDPNVASLQMFNLAEPEENARVMHTINHRAISGHHLGSLSAKMTERT